MRNLLFILVALLLSVGCMSKEEKARLEAVRTQDSIAHADSLREAAVLAARRDSIARVDSIRQSVLRADSLKKIHILVDKPSATLYLRDNGEILMEIPVCLGRGIGQKKRQGDHKTPEGQYKIKSIENASGFTHDFHDGRGKVKGVYGPWFFRLNTPQSSHIGIHGTDQPETVGARESDGCIRMRNEDLEELKKHVFVGMDVIINPDLPSSQPL